MTAPRQIIPGAVYHISRRCSQRQYLLAPDDEIDNAWVYCVGLAVEKFKVDLMSSYVASNHHHTVVHDPEARVAEFMCFVHGIFARVVNAMRGRWENVWSSEEACVTRLLDTETIIKTVVYGLSNPVKDGLVDRVHHWPGVNTYTALLANRELRATRPRVLFAHDGVCPKSITLKLTIPAHLGDRAAFVAAVREGVEAVEAAAAAERRKTGRGVVGRRAIRAQSWRESPTTEAPHRNLRPRFAGQRENRIKALLLYKAFQSAYRAARALLLGGLPAVFPAGTYWLARFANVPVSTDVLLLHDT